MIDFDPQANLSMGFGVDIFKLQYTIYDVLLNPNKGVELALMSTRITKLDLVPSRLDLAGAELELAGNIGREWLLKKALVKVKHNYDFILIDTPPSLGLYTQNALMCCNEVIITLQVHYYALRAIPQFLNTIKMVREYNPGLRLGGIICTMYDSRNKLSKVIEKTVRVNFKQLVFKTIIPFNIALAEAPASGVPITMYAPASATAKAYRELAKEVLERGK